MDIETLLTPQVRAAIGIASFVLIATAFYMAQFAYKKNRQRLKAWCQNHGFSFYKTFDIDWSWKRNCGVMKDENVQHWLSQHGFLRKSFNIHRSTLNIFNKGFGRIAYDIINTQKAWCFKYNYNLYIGKNSFLREQTAYYFTNKSWNLPHFTIQPNDFNYLLEDSYNQNTPFHHQHSEPIGNHHLLLTNHLGQTTDYLLPEFLDFIEEYEDVYIEVKGNEVCIIMQNQLAEVEDIDHTLQICESFVQKLTPVSQSEQMPSVA